MTRCVESICHLSHLPPEVLKDIQDICVLQDKLYALTSNVIVELKMEKNADEIRLTAQPLIDIKTKVLRLYNNEDILCALTVENQILLYNVSDKSSEHINGTDLGIVKADNIEKYIYIIIMCGSVTKPKESSVIIQTLKHPAH